MSERETIKAISIIAWLRSKFMPALEADKGPKGLKGEKVITDNPFNDIDNILLNLEEWLLDQLADEYHKEVIRPSGIESEYLYLKEDP